MDYQRLLGLRSSQPKFGLSSTDPEPVWRLGAAVNRYLTEAIQDGHGVFQYDFTTNLAAYTTPVQFIAGALSQVLGPSLQQQQMLRYPSASLAVVDAAGHDVAWVKAAEVQTILRSYLDARKGGF
jgi:pimeloyl-ACP methyl ester carboxylesterase